MGAKFNILTDESTDASKNVDTMISPTYGDLSDGQTTTATLSGGEFSRLYATDVNVSPPPEYGEGTLVGLKHYLYVDTVSQVERADGPVYRAWKLNQSIGTNEGGVTTGNTNIIVGSSQQNMVSANRTIDFGSGTVTTQKVGTSILHKHGTPFLYPSEAYNYNYENTGEKDAADMWNRYGNYLDTGQKVIFLEVHRNWRGKKDFFAPVDWREGAMGKTIPDIHEPKWSIHPGHEQSSQNTLPADNSLPRYTTESFQEVEDSELSRVQADASSGLDIVESYHMERKSVSADNDTEAPLYHARATYSNKETVSSGTSMKLHTYWKDESSQSFTIPDSNSLHSGDSNGTVSNVQHIRVGIEDFPCPFDMTTTKDDNNGFAEFKTISTFDITLKIEALETAFDTSFVAAGTNDARCESLSHRSLAFMWSERKPGSDESFYNYVRNHSENLNADIDFDECYMGAIIANLDSTGQLFGKYGTSLFPTSKEKEKSGGEASGRHLRNWTSDTINRCIRLFGSNVTIFDNTKTSRPMIGIPTEQWFTLRFVFKPGGKGATVFVLDPKTGEKLISDSTEMRLSGGSNEMNVPNSWPRYFTIWLNNYKSDSANDANISSDRATESIVYIDSMKWYCYEPGLLNATTATENILYHSNLRISADTSIDAKNRDTVAPTFISMGFANKTTAATGIDEDANTNFLFNGYTSSNLASNDAIADECITAGWSTGTVPLGVQTSTRLFKDDGKTEFIGLAAEAYSLSASKLCTSGPENALDNFSQKGFMGLNIRESAYSNDTFTATENIFFSTRIRRLVNPKTIEVWNTDVFNVSSDVTFRIYYPWRNRASSGLGNPLWYRDVTVAGINRADNTVTFVEDISNFVNLHKPHSLMVGPVRFWVILKVVPSSVGVASTDYVPTRTYTSILTAANGEVAPPNAAATGATYNESDFSDNKLYQNSWSFDPAMPACVLETEKDYGFGTYDTDEGTGGYIKELIPTAGEYNEIDISALVAEETLEPEDTFSLLYKPALPSAGHEMLIHTTEGTNKPFLLSVFEDELPENPELKIEPSDIEPMYPKFTWTATEKDLWYGLLHFGTELANNQYHKAVAHLPLNEGSVTGGEVKNYDYVDGDSANVGIDDAPTISYEGLAGYALHFANTADQLTFTTDNDPTDKATYLMHVTPTGGVGKLLTDSGNAIEIEALTNWKIRAKVRPLRYGNSVVLTSSSQLPANIPACIIVTVDTTEKANNVKLFINGKLEDQTGVATGTGPSSTSTEHWKKDRAIKTGVTYSLGNDGSSNSAICKMEEIVIYNTVVYPVIPRDQEFTLIKNFKELVDSTTGSSLSYSARLFMKDYHNIRGKSVNEVAVSIPVSFRKAVPKIVGAN